MATPPPLPIMIPAPAEAMLRAWLHTATHDLCDEARTRIESEVRRHVEETASALLTEGRPHEAAFEEAVRGLGSATIAKRGFRETNLTQRQSRLMRSLPEYPVSPGRLTESQALWIAGVYAAFSIFGIVLLAVFYLVTKEGAFGLFLWTTAIGSVYLLATIVTPFVIKAVLRRGAWRTAIAMAMAFSILSATVFPLLVVGLSHRMMALLWFVPLYPANILSVVRAVEFAALWQKLRRIPPDRMRFG